MGIIYKLTFSNGKVYIGMTTVSLKNRIACHRNLAKKEKPKLLVHRAWKMYGDPEVEILLSAEHSNILGQAERFFILLYGSYGENGYNLTSGGEESPMKRPEIAAKVSAILSSPEHSKRIKALHTGSKRSEETKAAMSAMRKGMGLGVPKTPEHRRKIGEAGKGKSFNLGSKRSPETRAKQSDSAVKSWTPCRREQMRKISIEREAKKRTAK